MTGPECQCQEADIFYHCLSSPLGLLHGTAATDKKLTMGSHPPDSHSLAYLVIRTGIPISAFSVPRQSFSHLYPGNREQSSLPRDAYENCNDPIVVLVPSIETQR